MKVLSDHLTSQSECSRLEFCLILANVTSSLQTRKEISKVPKATHIYNCSLNIDFVRIKYELVKNIWAIFSDFK